MAHRHTTEPWKYPVNQVFLQLSVYSVTKVGFYSIQTPCHWKIIDTRHSHEFIVCVCVLASCSIGGDRYKHRVCVVCGSNIIGKIWNISVSARSRCGIIIIDHTTYAHKYTSTPTCVRARAVLACSVYSDKIFRMESAVSIEIDGHCSGRLSIYALVHETFRQWVEVWIESRDDFCFVEQGNLEYLEIDFERNRFYAVSVRLLSIEVRTVGQIWH